ncbi:hypothetical protein [Leadbettera azotonutricia]|uniref:Putative lipoprotein n=1 Tax=Leadbettera azotonutricia (strain ATCC BAA-888 / DSM 13862 / ZAS-9) TaxID=545695 RepID=F5Y7U6_LEAAZ|nr:hypothetical protein [Leadbettera azotonutricia]AEF80500.1 putative lipoprotein [Leadbettera azotonutricia ZAS-9]
MKPFSSKLSVLLLISMFAISCQSVQKDLLISSMDESARASIEELEETIVRLEAAPAANALASARRKTEELEKEGIPDADFQALLAAWSGRLSLLENKTPDAQRELKKSQTLAPGNWPAVLLEARLERDRQKRLIIVDSALSLEDLAAPAGGESNGPGELSLERGRILLELNRFAEAVASFDLAFGLLEGKPFYREIYQPARDRAWELHDIEAGNKSITLMQHEWIDWKDLIEITKTETDLLRFLTAGRDWKAEEIFSRLLDRSFIPPTQDISLTEWPQTKPKIGDEVLRSGAAWFLWHLYAENRSNRGLLSRYASRYANTPNARSPIQDLPLLSPFFDSILGCVESEFMSLPDGKNFNPGEKLRGSAYLAMLKKLAP